MLLPSEHLLSAFYKTLPSKNPSKNPSNLVFTENPYRRLLSLVALYRAMQLRFGYGFESCDANGPRNVKNTNLAKHRPIFLPPLRLVGSKELVLKVPKRGQFHAAIRVTRKRCDSCAQVALGTRTVSRRNF